MKAGAVEGPAKVWNIDGAGGGGRMTTGGGARSAEKSTRAGLRLAGVHAPLPKSGQGRCCSWWLCHAGRVPTVGTIDSIARLTSE